MSKVQVYMTKNKFNVAQNVGRICIGRKDTFPFPFTVISGLLFHGSKFEKCKKYIGGWGAELNREIVSCRACVRVVRGVYV